MGHLVQFMLKSGDLLCSGGGGSVGCGSGGSGCSGGGGGGGDHTGEVYREVDGGRPVARVGGLPCSLRMGNDPPLAGDST